MKNLMILFLIVPALAFTSIEEDITSITKALNSGDATTLSKYFDSDVELSILDNEDIYSKAEASKIVQTFFADNATKSFAKAHSGQSKGNDSQYVIGNLTTSVGAYRVYIYMKVSGKNYLIQELRIDKK